MPRCLTIHAMLWGIAIVKYSFSYDSMICSGRFSDYFTKIVSILDGRHGFSTNNHLGCRHTLMFHVVPRPQTRLWRDFKGYAHIFWVQQSIRRIGYTFPPNRKRKIQGGGHLYGNTYISACELYRNAIWTVKRLHEDSVHTGWKAWLFYE